MTNQNEKLYTIGEISKMTNIPIRTFHYYDEIGLFKPAHIDDITKYRYYSESQIHHLDLIKSLKYIGTSLNEIKSVQNLTTKELVEFLAQQQVVVEKRLLKMQEVQETLLKTKQMLEDQINIPVYGHIYESNAKVQRIIAIKTDDATPNSIPEKYFNSLAENIEREGTVMNSRYGGIIPLKHYTNIDTVYYDYIFTPLLTERYLDKLNKNIEIFNIPEGDFICIAFEYDELSYITYFNKLADYANKLNHKILPVVYEVFMPSHYSPSKRATFTVELKIQIM